MVQIKIGEFEYNLPSGTVSIGDSADCLIKIKTPYNMHKISACSVVTQRGVAYIRNIDPDVRVQKWDKDVKDWRNITSLSDSGQEYELRCGHRYQLQFFPSAQENANCDVEIDVFEVADPPAKIPSTLAYLWPGVIMLIPAIVVFFSTAAALILMGALGIILVGLSLNRLQDMGRSSAQQRLHLGRLIVGMVMVYSCAAIIIAGDKYSAHPSEKVSVNK